VTVILSGVGGDELFGGYRRYLGNHYARQWQRLPGWSQKLAAAAAARLPSDRHSPWLNKLRLAKNFVASAQLSPDERYRAYLQVFSRQAAAGLLLRNDPGATDPLAEAFAGAGGDDELNRLFAVDAETQLPDDLLLLTDKMSMAVSLECRVPLLDHELAELAARIPAEAKVPGGQLKHILKSALADTLPADILHRQKRGFGTPMGAWLKRELAPVLRNVLSREVVEARGWFNYPAIAALMDGHQGNRLDGTDPLLALLNLEIWSRVFLDRQDPEAVADELKRLI
jgi:asparagine synthase (glutamine-hydrolysing)